MKQLLRTGLLVQMMAALSEADVVPSYHYSNVYSCVWCSGKCSCCALYHYSCGNFKNGLLILLSCHTVNYNFSVF